MGGVSSSGSRVVRLLCRGGLELDRSGSVSSRLTVISGDEEVVRCIRGALRCVVRPLVRRAGGTVSLITCRNLRPGMCAKLVLH